MSQNSSPAQSLEWLTPKVVFLIFSAGKLVCVGAKKEEQVYEAVDKIQQLLEEKELIYYPS